MHNAAQKPPDIALLCVTLQSAGLAGTRPEREQYGWLRSLQQDLPVTRTSPVAGGSGAAERWDERIGPYGALGVSGRVERSSTPSHIIISEGKLRGKLGKL
ncbi:hypothetical protein MKX08_006048 [Trichoderma sp. CBMAI-0020]|nr:hypothetical protein MKX08_006048 [Trichoderma sp. CBMAI-0020]